MKCIEWILKADVSQAFVMPFGITLTKGSKLLVKESMARNIQINNSKTLKPGKTVDKEKLSAGSYEIVPDPVITKKKKAKKKKANKSAASVTNKEHKSL